MRKRKASKRKKNPYKLYIKGLELLRKEINNLIDISRDTMNSTKKHLKSSIQNNLNNISKNLKSPKHLINDIKDSNLIKTISNDNILDAKDFILI